MVTKLFNENQVVSEKGCKYKKEIEKRTYKNGHVIRAHL